MAPTTLLITEDDYLVREGARAVLAAHPRLERRRVLERDGGFAVTLDRHQ